MKISRRSIILAVCTVLLFIGALVSVFMDKSVIIEPEPEPEPKPDLELIPGPEPKKEPVKSTINGPDEVKTG